MKTDQPFFSVIIPAYNCGKSITQTLNSVINQEYSNIEIVVIDDGSTDSTYTFIQSTFPNIKLISQSNGGPSVARNTGIKNASGKFVAFLDADDLWEPFHLKNAFDILNTHPQLKWYCSAWAVYEDGAIVRPKIFQGAENGIIANYFSATHNLYLVHTCCIIIERPVFDSIGDFKTEFKRGEDVDMWSRVAAKHVTLGYSKKVSAYYNRSVDDSLTRSVLPVEVESAQIHSSWNSIKKDSIPEMKVMFDYWITHLLKDIIKQNKFSYAFNLFSLWPAMTVKVRLKHCAVLLFACITLMGTINPLSKR